MSKLLRLYHAFLWILAVFFITAAVVLTLTRALTPMLNAHKDFFEKTTENLLHEPVKIHHLELGWFGLQPQILLKDVEIDNAETKIPFLHVQRFYVAIDLWDSLWAWKLMPSFIKVRGVRLSIQQYPNGVYKINDVTVDSHGSSDLDLKKLQSWFLGQNTVALQDVSIGFRDQYGSFYPIVIRLLKLHNSGLAHKLTGSVVLAGTDSAVDMVITATGDLKDFKEAHLKGYAEVQHLDLHRWLNKNNYAGYQVLSGDAEARLWLNWNQGRWKKQVAEVKLYQLHLKSTINQQDFILKSLTGVFSFRPLQNGWRLAANSVQVITHKKIWSPASLMIKKEVLENSEISLAIALSYADLADVTTLMKGSDRVSLTVSSWLLGAAPSGVVQDFAFSGINKNQVWSAYQLKASLKDLAISGQQNYPGFNHINALLIANQDQGQVKLMGNASVWSIKKLFSHSLLFSRIQATLNWKRVIKGWSVSLNQAFLANSDLSLKIKGGFLFPFGQSKPSVNIRAEAILNTPLKVAYYLPLEGVGSHAEAWLDQAFTRGAPIAANLILRGNLADFPFINKPGQFLVSAKITDLDVHYADGWPALNHLAGMLYFSGDRMEADLDSGSSSGLMIKKAKVIIPVIASSKPVHVLVDSDIVGKGQGFLNFIQETPLRSSIGKTLSKFNLDGNAALSLGLDLPLANLETTVVKGVLNFEDNVLSMAGWEQKISQLNGGLSFTRDTISANQLNGVLLGQPLTARVATSRVKNESILLITFNTIFDVDWLKKYKPMLSSVLIDGKTSVDGLLSIPMSSSDHAPSRLTLRTNLVGITVQYPPPIAKAPMMSIPFVFSLDFGEAVSGLSLRADYGDLIHSAWSLKQGKIFSLAIYLGHGSAEIPLNQGVFINGNVSMFDWAIWRPFFETKSEGNKEKASGWLKTLMDLPFKASVSFDTLKLSTLILHSARLTLSRLSSAWQAGLVSSPVSGELIIPDAYPLSPLQANFDHINFSPTLLVSNGSNAKMNPSEMPNLILSVADFRYRDKDLGKVDAIITPNSRGVVIKKLSIQSALLSGNFFGSWLRGSDGHDVSMIRGSVTTKDLQTVLKNWQVSSSLLAADSYLAVNWSWPGSLFDFNLKGLTGDAYVKLQNGWIVDLNSSTTEKLNLGRLLTLLSLQHFMFHINDLSRNGYSFNLLTGHFTFSNGIVSTDDLTSKGVVADIKAAGDVNLLQKTLAVKLGIVVNVTSSLPVIATIASGFNPLVGLATWLADKAVHKAMDARGQYGYLLKGSWHDPEVLKLGSHGEVVPVPVSSDSDVASSTSI